MKSAIPRKQAVSDQRMKVGVKVQIFAEGVDGHDDAREDVGEAQGHLHELDQASYNVLS